MKNFLTLALLAAAFCTACNNDPKSTMEKTKAGTESKSPEKTTTAATGDGLWKGSFSNGMKGATISFAVTGDRLKDLTFEGYWRCDGRLDLTTIGPEKSFSITGGKVDGVIIEPEGGMAPFRYELHGSIGEEKAEGTLRISNVPAGCDTYQLNWTATKQ